MIIEYIAIAASTLIIFSLGIMLGKLIYEYIKASIDNKRAQENYYKMIIETHKESLEVLKKADKVTDIGDFFTLMDPSGSGSSNKH